MLFVLILHEFCCCESGKNHFDNLMSTYLDFEKPIAELETKLADMKQLAEENMGMNHDAAVGGKAVSCFAF